MLADRMRFPLRRLPAIASGSLQAQSAGLSMSADLIALTCPESLVNLTPMAYYRLEESTVTRKGAMRLVGNTADVTNFTSGNAVGYRHIAHIDGYLFILDSANNRVFSVDVSDKTTPLYGAEVVDAALSASTDIIADGTHIYVTSGTSFFSIDVSNPLSMSIADTLSVSISDMVTIDGSYAYVLCKNSDRFYIVDISTPAALSITSTYTDNPNMASPYCIAIEGNYAFVVRANRVLCVDISNKSSPAFGAYLEDATNLNSAVRIIVNSGKAYIATELGTRRFSIVDISTPLSMSLLGSVVVDSTYQQPNPSYLWFDDNLVFSHNRSTTGGNVVAGSFDVSDPANPRFFGAYQDPPGTVAYPATSSIYSEGFIYAMSENLNTVSVVGVNLTAGGKDGPTYLEGSVDDATDLFLPAAIAVNGNYVFASTSSNTVGKRIFTVVDASDKSAPSIAGVTADDAGLRWGYDAACTADGNTCYVSNWDLISIIDTSTKTAPYRSGEITGFTITRGIKVKGDYLYVTDSSAKKISIYDITTPASPSLVGSVTDATDLANVYYLDINDAETQAVAACTGGRVTVIDITTKASPSVVGSLLDVTYLQSIDVIAYLPGEMYALATGASHGISSIDLTTPASPSRVQTIEHTDYQLSGVAINVVGNTAIVTSSSSINYVDVTDPSDMYLYHKYVTASKTNAAIDAAYLYTLNQTINELEIYNLNVWTGADNVVAADSSGNAIDGAFVGSPIARESGLTNEGYSMLFDGIYDYLDVSDVAANLGGSAAISCLIWIKPTTAATTQQLFWFESSTTDVTGFGAWIEGSQLKVMGRSVAADTATTVTESDVTLANDTTYMVYAGIDAATGKVFVSVDADTIEEASGTMAQSTISLGLVARIASASNAAPVRFGGGLDEVVFFSRLLNQGELTAASGVCAIP